MSKEAKILIGILGIVIVAIIILIVLLSAPSIPGVSPDAKAMSAMAQIQAMAELIKTEEKSYSNLSCADNRMRKLCEDIKEQIEIEPVIQKTEDQYCAHIKLKKGGFYCIDSKGFRKKIDIDPSTFGYCDGITFVCQKVEDETADWQTYRNEEYGFEIEYPKDTRVFGGYFEEAIPYNAYIGSNNPHLVFSASINDLELYPETGIYIYANEDASQPVKMYGNQITSMCTESLGSETAETKNINGEIFFIVGEDIEDAAMQGRRSLYSIYDIVKNGKCYKIASDVTWKSIEFIRTAYEGIEPTQQELEDEQRWIKSQQEINEQILSTFRFLD